MMTGRLDRHDLDEIVRRVADRVAALQEPAMADAQAAAYLGMSVRSLRERARAGEVPCHRHFGKTYYYKLELDRAIRSGEDMDRPDEGWNDCGNYLSNAPAVREDSVRNPYETFSF